MTDVAARAAWSAGWRLVGRALRRVASSAKSHGVSYALPIAMCITACAPEPSGPRERLCAGSGCSNACRSLKVEVCDTREPECQDVVFDSVRCVRGSKLTKPPRTAFVPQSDLIEQRREANQGQQDLVTQVWTAYVDQGLGAFRLIAPGTTLAEAQVAESENIGGVQEPDIVQIVESEEYSSWWAMRLLAHEYVHAQQDHDYGGLGNLHRRYARSNATSQGIQAYVEGEAELYAWLTHAFMREADPDPWQLDEFFALEDKALRSRVSDSASPWTPARQWQHYAIGARHLHAVWQSGHNIAVRGVLHNLNADFGAWASGFAPRYGPQVSHRPVCTPDGTQLMLRDSLGPSGLFALLIAATSEDPVSPIEEAWDLAAQLTEDQLQMYAPTLGESVTQAEWLTGAASSAMCASKPGGAQPHEAPDAGLLAAEGGSLGAGNYLDGGVDAAVDAAVPLPVPFARDASASDGAADAAVPPTSAPDAATATLVEGDLDDPRARLLPGGPVWASWAFGFETAATAKRVAALVGQLEHVHVERDSDRIVLRITERSPSDVHLSEWAKKGLCEP